MSCLPTDHLEIRKNLKIIGHIVKYIKLGKFDVYFLTRFSSQVDYNVLIGDSSLRDMLVFIAYLLVSQLLVFDYPLVTIEDNVINVSRHWFSELLRYQYH